jgi:hypothetical protein
MVVGRPGQLASRLVGLKQAAAAARRRLYNPPTGPSKSGVPRSPDVESPRLARSA